MGITNDFERDLNAQIGLHRSGRVDMIVFQNIADAGDGHPGMQRCFRNYMHEGGMEKDLDINNYKIINLAEPTLASDGARKSNVDAVQTDLDNHKASTGESHTYINQDVQTTASPTFVKVTLTQTTGTSPLIVSSTTVVTNLNSDKVDGYDFNQALLTSSSPVFANINISDDIVHSGDIDTLISFGTDIISLETGGSSRLDLNDSGLRIGAAGARVTQIQNNDSLGTSDTILCTQGNVKAYSDSHIISKELNEVVGSLADGDILVYRTSTGKWHYETKPVGEAHPSNYIAALGATQDWIGADRSRYGGIQFPAADDNCTGLWLIRIPTWATGTFNLKVEYWSLQDTSTYSGLWYVTSKKEGDLLPVTPNIIDGSNAYDLNTPSGGLVYLKTIPITGVAGGETVHVEFQSDTSNSYFVVIRSMWIEWS